MPMQHTETVDAVVFPWYTALLAHAQAWYFKSRQSKYPHMSQTPENILSPENQKGHQYVERDTTGGSCDAIRVPVPSLGQQPHNLVCHCIVTH